MPKLGTKIFTLTTLLLGIGTSSLPAQEIESRPEPATRATPAVERTFTLPAGETAALAARSPVSPEEAPGFFRVSGNRVEKVTNVLGSGFEGSFPGSTWSLFSLGSSDVTWGRSTFRAASGNASVWCAQNGSDAPSPGGNVPANTQSWMVAGPFDLSGASQGELAFDLWLETEPSFDFFYAAASLDGSNFNALGIDQDTNGWQRLTFDLANWGSLGDLTGESAVWIAFLYESDFSVTFEGAYVDNVSMTVDDNTGGGDLDLVINQIDAGACPRIEAIVSVLDGQGNPVTGLTESNFTIQEDGVGQSFTVDTVGSGGNALAVSLVLDGSGSLSNTDIVNVRAAGNELIDLLAPNDRVAVYHFGSDVTRVLDYTTNHAAARAAVDAIDDNLGLTSLYDAIVDAANHSTTVSGRRALVVMTDGGDNDSSNDIQDAIAAAQSAGVPVFTIGFSTAQPQVLSDIANQTGGLFFQGATSGDLQTIFNQIGQTLNNQFILGWNTTAVDGGSHTVTVQVQRQGASDTGSVTYSQANTPCAGGGGGPCTPGTNSLCLLDNQRFRVEVEWLDFDGNRGPGTVASCGSEDSGLFWFFNPANWEMLVKMVDGCGNNGRFWVFAAATTNVGYTLTVTDTLTNVQKSYDNPLGVASPAITDTNAFATCP